MATQNQIDDQLNELHREMQVAAQVLSRLEPGISIFGSARTPKDDPIYLKTTEIAALLSKAKFNVISGGGPGIMEAANKGAFENGGVSIGLNIKLPFEVTNNPYQTHSLFFNYFASRKTTFFLNSIGYIVMPGGYGTLDEISETLTLIQTRKIHPAPIVFVGTEFWKGLIDWFKEKMLGYKYINESDLELFKVMDDPQEIVDYFVAYRQNSKSNLI